MDDMRVVLIGDVMLDVFTEAHVSRRSPEADCDVALVDDKRYYAGGAGNVYKALKAIGIKDVTLVGVMGSDDSSKKLASIIDSPNSMLISNPCWRTTNKERLIVDNKHAYRIDTEVILVDYPYTRQQLSDIYGMISECDFVVVSDYNKGVVTKQLLEMINEAEVPIILDPKPQQMHKYVGIDIAIVTPNEKELFLMAPAKDVQASCRRLSKELKCDVVATLGHRGCMVCDYGEKPVGVRGYAVKEVDAIGAGDVFLSAYAYAAFAMGCDSITSARLANYAASLSVQHPFIYNPTWAEIEQGSGEWLANG